jgi:hypothetical protein
MNDTSTPSSKNQSALTLELPPSAYLDTRFHLVSGKGGVGKSTVSLLLGLYFASQGLKTLICEVDQRGFCLRAFQHDPHQEGGEICALQSVDFPFSTLSGVNIHFKNALLEYGSMKLKIKSLSALLLDNPLSQALMSLVPGVQDLVAFGKAFNHEREEEKTSFFSSPFKGKRKEKGKHHPQKCWDRVILDAPATGHGLTFLTLPKLVCQTVPFGNLRREASDMWDLVSQPTRCTLHVVSLAEELPVQETHHLCRALEDELDLKPGVIWTNRCPERSLSPSLLHRLKHHQKNALDDPTSFITLMDHLLSIDDDQQKWRDELKTLPYAQASIPFLSDYLQHPVKTLYALLCSSTYKENTYKEKMHSRGEIE